MKKLLLTACFPLSSLFLFGQGIPCVQGIGTYHVIINTPGLKFEAPPWLTPGCWRGYYGIDGINTIFMGTPQNLINGNNQGSCGFPPVSTPTESSFTLSTSYQKTAVMIPQANQMYRRNYSGIFSSHNVTVGGSPVIVGFIHGENKGTNNTVLPNPNGDFWTNYFAFVNLAWVDNNSSTNWGHQLYTDEGPILWPSAGYVNSTSTQKLSQGLRHPSSIIYNGYIYIYYKEENSPITWGPGKNPGVKLARVAITNSKNPSAYQVYYNGSWYSSLPAGLTKNNVSSYKNVPGPLSSVVTGDYDTHRFSVAKVRGTNYFLGVEEYADGNEIVIALRKSTDLISWGPRYDIWRDYAFWDSGRIHYPIFLDKYGWTNTEIDEDRFFILGTFSNSGDWYKISRLSLTLDCSSSSSFISSVDENEMSIHTPGNLTVYPNPFFSKVFINYLGTDSNAEITFRNSVGEIIVRESLKAGMNEIYLEKAPKGIVYYQLHDKNSTTTGKLIKDE